jgi:DNA uptake protein ComE-like DNA-binding protein
MTVSTINTATAKGLKLLPEIGKKTVANVIKYTI